MIVKDKETLLERYSKGGKNETKPPNSPLDIPGPIIFMPGPVAYNIK